MRSAWNDAMADLAAARKSVAKAGSNEDRLDKACDIELEAVWRVIKTPCPEWRAFAQKMAVAQVDKGDFFDGMAPFLVEEAQRLAAEEPTENEAKIFEIDGALDCIAFAMEAMTTATEHCEAEIVGPLDAGFRIVRQQIEIIRESIRTAPSGTHTGLLPR